MRHIIPTTAFCVLALLALQASAQQVSFSCGAAQNGYHRLFDITVEVQPPSSEGDTTQGKAAIRSIHAIVEERTLSLSKDGGRLRLDFRTHDVLRTDAHGVTRPVSTAISGKAYAVDLRGENATITYPEGGGVDSTEYRTLFDFLALCRLIWKAPELVRGARLAIGDELQPGNGSLTGPGALAEHGPRFQDLSMRLESVSPYEEDERAALDLSMRLEAVTGLPDSAALHAHGRIVISTRTCRLLNLAVTAWDIPRSLHGEVPITAGVEANEMRLRMRCNIQYIDK
jgi:hypothetical protein